MALEDMRGKGMVDDFYTADFYTAGLEAEQRIGQVEVLNELLRRGVGEAVVGLGWLRGELDEYFRW